MVNEITIFDYSILLINLFIVAIPIFALYRAWRKSRTSPAPWFILGLVLWEFVELGQIVAYHLQGTVYNNSTIYFLFLRFTGLFGTLGCLIMIIFDSYVSNGKLTKFRLFLTSIYAGAFLITLIDPDLYNISFVNVGLFGHPYKFLSMFIFLITGSFLIRTAYKMYKKISSEEYSPKKNKSLKNVILIYAIGVIITFYLSIIIFATPIASYWFTSLDFFASSGLLILGIIYFLNPEMAYILPIIPFDYLISHENGSTLYKYKFYGKIGIDENLFTGMLKAFTSFMQETFQSSFKKIDYEDFVLLFHKRSVDSKVYHFFVVNQNLAVLYNALENIAKDFYDKYIKTLGNEAEIFNIDRYKDCNTLVKKHFQFLSFKFPTDSDKMAESESNSK